MSVINNSDDKLNRFLSLIILIHIRNAWRALQVAAVLMNGYLNFFQKKIAEPFSIHQKEKIQSLGPKNIPKDFYIFGSSKE